MKPVKYISALFCLFLVCGCSLGPDFKLPTSGLSNKQWINNTQNASITAEKIQHDWWNAFGDETLSHLIMLASEENLDLKIANKNLEEANALLNQASSVLMPSINADGSASRRKLSENAGIPTGPFNPRIQEFYSGGLISNWELDIFGGTRRNIAASYARFESLQERERDTLLIVYSEVARNYIELRGAQQRYKILERNIELQTQSLYLVEKRLSVGEASMFDSSRAQAQLQLTKSRLPNIKAQIDTLIYRISVLVGQQPNALIETLSPTQRLPLNPEIVPIGLPSEMLRRRPDIRAAEKNLEAEINDIGARIADLFPKFTLTGAAGYESIGTSDLISSGSQFWSIGPGINWPIFSAGLIRAQINAEEAQADATALEYEKTVLLALEDVEGALVLYGNELETTRLLKNTVELTNKNLRYSNQRFDNGLDNLTILIDTQRQALDAEDELISSQTQALLKLVRLYKSLGGGWEIFEE